MQFLVFAHRGEAQEFINKLNFKQIERNFYQNESSCLIITGEGSIEVMSELPYYLGKYNITEIINYGIAGALSKSLELEKIYEIRSTYAHNGTEPYFKSFQTTCNTSHLDCITTDKRVLSDEYANEIDSFAQIVDREVWAVGKIATNFKLPFRSYKLISDFAGSATQCFDLKQRALHFSQLMYQHYLQLESSEVNEELVPFELPFHASFTLKKRIEDLFSKLAHKLTLTEALTLFKDTIQREQDYNAKQFIDFLEFQINPINKHIHKRLFEIFKPLENIGAQIQYDKKLEKKKITLKMDINGQTNIKNLTKALSHFNYQEIEDIWEGKFDV